MQIIILILTFCYLYLVGNALSYKFKANTFLLGFSGVYLILTIPVLLVNYKIISFTNFTILVSIILIVSFIYAVVLLIKNKFKFQKFNYHIIISSFIWIMIYLTNTNFSVLSGNGFDDYYYIGHQNHLINNFTHELTKSFHPHSTIDGWVYINSSICKIFNIDVNLFNKFVMSILNIIFSVSVFDATIKMFAANKYRKWHCYVPVILIVFPLISFEYWFGSISRLIYRPFYGSSLSVITIPLLILHAFHKYFNDKSKWWVIILITFCAVTMIHTINILVFVFILLSFIFLSIKNKYLKFTIPLILMFILWSILKLFFPYLLVSSKSNSTFEYWNIMYDFTRWAFLLIYIASVVVYFTKLKRTIIDHMLIIYIPLFVMVLFFTGLKNVAFNFIYGFGLQRFLSQLLIFICLYFFTNFLGVSNNTIKKFYTTIIVILSIVFIQQSSVYSGIMQQISAFKNNNYDLKFTNSSRDMVFTQSILAKINKNENLLTQHWININYDNQIPNNTYYNYVAHNSCSYNLFSNLSAQNTKSLVYEAQKINDINNTFKEVEKYNIKYLLISEKYFEPNGFICNENLNYLYNTFAQKYILNVSPNIKQKQTAHVNNVVSILMQRNYKYEILDLPTYKSKFGRIYLFKLK